MTFLHRRLFNNLPAMWLTILKLKYYIITGIIFISFSYSGRLLYAAILVSFNLGLSYLLTPYYYTINPTPRVTILPLTGINIEDGHIMIDHEDITFLYNMTKIETLWEEAYKETNIADQVRRYDIHFNHYCIKRTLQTYAHFSKPTQDLILQFASTAKLEINTHLDFLVHRHTFLQLVKNNSSTNGIPVYFQQDITPDTNNLQLTTSIGTVSLAFLLSLDPLNNGVTPLLTYAQNSVEQNLSDDSKIYLITITTVLIASALFVCIELVSESYITH